MSQAAESPSVLTDLEPDVVLLTFHAAEMGEADIPGYFRAKHAESGAFFLITDFSQTKSMPKGAADAGPGMIKAEWFRAVIYIKASRAVRMVLKVFNLGMFLVGQTDFPMIFVDSLEEAQAAITDLRRKSPKST